MKFSTGRRIRVVIAAIVAVIAIGLTVAPFASANLPRGDWVGLITQPGGSPSKFHTRITLDPGQLQKGERAGTARYPDLPCRGKLTYTKRSGDYYYFRLTITQGDCLNGVIRLNRIQSGLHYDWHDSSHHSYGNLHRPAS